MRRVDGVEMPVDYIVPSYVRNAGLLRSFGGSAMSYRRGSRWNRPASGSISTLRSFQVPFPLTGKNKSLISLFFISKTSGC